MTRAEKLYYNSSASELKNKKKKEINRKFRWKIFLFASIDTIDSIKRRKFRLLFFEKGKGKVGHVFMEYVNFASWIIFVIYLIFYGYSKPWFLENLAF